MLGQTFDSSDVPRVFFLFFLEILLSGDNAIVLGLLSSHLPEKLKQKALFIGLSSAFFLRALALFLIQFMIEFKWVQLVGAAYLIYLCLRHFSKNRGRHLTPTGGHSFWKTVILIELFDLAFAMDSILAGFAFIQSDGNLPSIESKIWIIYAGGMLGLVGIRYAAHLFSRLMGRFPGLETSAYLMVGWIGFKLGYTTFPNHPHEVEPIFWTGMILLFLLGFGKKRAKI